MTAGALAQARKKHAGGSTQLLAVCFDAAGQEVRHRLKDSSKSSVLRNPD